jgi:hypothetical protein
LPIANLNSQRDLFGVVVAVIGAVTVVLASNASDTRLNYDTLLRAISQLPFIFYSCIYIVGAIILATLSEGQIGKDWVFVDIGLCALFGQSSAFLLTRFRNLYSLLIHTSLYYLYNRRLHSTLYKSNIDSSYPSMDRNIQKLDHVSSPCSIAPFSFLVLPRLTFHAV